MNKETAIEAPLAKLREPFPPHQISQLPKPYKKDSPKGNCAVCGGYHGLPAMHLDYVGHAALTDRLLDTDPLWHWEPVGFTAEGLPAMDRNGGLWIKLTVCGVTRYGYGDAGMKTGGDATKEMIGDALRNAAMRFGAALDLWHKGDLHVEEDGPKDETRKEKLDGPYTTLPKLETAIKAFSQTLASITDFGEFNAWMQTPEVVELEKQAMRDLPSWWETGEGLPEEFAPMVERIHLKKRVLEEGDSIHPRTQSVLEAG